MTELFIKEYETKLNTPSDIYEHLPTLKKYASECKSVIELGVRKCVSSWALALGLLSNNSEKKVLYMNDINVCDTKYIENASASTNLKIITKWGNNLELELDEDVDLTFIDTWHVYGQLKRELAKFAPRTNKYIIMHDTTVDGIYGETIRMRMNAQEQSRQSGYPIEEIQCGLQKAITEFLEANPAWQVKEVYTNNNGLTILKREILP